MSAHNPSKYSVLLIDDNDIDLKINSKIISMTGRFDRVNLCNSGEKALDFLCKNMSDQDELPNLILLDIQMPEMNGFEFLEKYKKFSDQLKDHCVIAMLSSTLDFGDIKKAEANPYVVKLLKKPLNINELQQLIQENLY